MAYSYSAPDKDSIHANFSNFHQNFISNLQNISDQTSNFSTSPQISHSLPYNNLNDIHTFENSNYNDIFSPTNFQIFNNLSNNSDQYLCKKQYYTTFDPKHNTISYHTYFNLSFKKLESQDLSFNDKIKLKIVDDPDVLISNEISDPDSS